MLVGALDAVESWPADLELDQARVHVAATRTRYADEPGLSRLDSRGRALVGRQPGGRSADRRERARAVAEAAQELARLREVNAQLQTALDSRVLIEQAKGVLAERFALDTDRAFELLRTGARNSRLNIHELARVVMGSRSTPPEIEALLPCVRDGAGPRRQGLRAMNERIAERGAQAIDPKLLVCECGDERCAEAIEVAAEQFAEVRGHRGRFVVFPGHERPATERVVSARARFVVVEPALAGSEIPAGEVERE